MRDGEGVCQHLDTDREQAPAVTGGRAGEGVCFMGTLTAVRSTWPAASAAGHPSRSWRSVRGPVLTKVSGPRSVRGRARFQAEETFSEGRGAADEVGFTRGDLGSGRAVRTAPWPVRKQGRLRRGEGGLGSRRGVCRFCFRLKRAERRPWLRAHGCHRLAPTPPCEVGVDISFGSQRSRVVFTGSHGEREGTVLSWSSCFSRRF